MSVFDELEQRFTSGNDVPVSSITLSRDLYERLRAENEALKRDAEWRTMETAPKDGTLIVAYNEFTDTCAIVGYDMGDGDPPHWSDKPNINAAESLWFNDMYFTLWKPLKLPDVDRKELAQCVDRAMKG